MEKNKNSSSIPSLTNVAIIFEALCGVLTQAIIDKNEDLGKKVKQVIIRGIQKNPYLKEELELYRTITQNSFKDQTIGSAFVAELLRHASTIKTKNIQEGIAILLEDMKKSGLMQCIQPKNTETSQIYSQIEDLVALRRQETRTVQESKDYYSLLDSVVASGAVLLERGEKAKVILKPRVLLTHGKINSRVLQEAIKVFQDEFSEQLSPSIKELIQDYLYYKKNDRFLHSLAKRLRLSIGEAKVFIGGLTKINEATKNSFDTIVENMEACYENIKRFSTQEADEKKLFNLVRETAQQLDICKELQQIV